MEQILVELTALKARLESVLAEPRLHRKDVARLLGVSDRTISRRLKDSGFPRPTYDAGRPKWRPSDFNGQPLPS